jgi:hypothetical protein
MILAPGVDENARHQEAAHRLTQCKKANPNSAFEAKNCATVTSPQVAIRVRSSKADEKLALDTMQPGTSFRTTYALLDDAEVRAVSDLPGYSCDQHPVDSPKVTIAACVGPIGISKEPSFGVSTSHPIVPVGDPSVLVSNV